MSVSCLSGHSALISIKIAEFVINMMIGSFKSRSVRPRIVNSQTFFSLVLFFIHPREWWHHLLSWPSFLFCFVSANQPWPFLFCSIRYLLFQRVSHPGWSNYTVKACFTAGWKLCAAPSVGCGTHWRGGWSLLWYPWLVAVKLQWTLVLPFTVSSSLLCSSGLHHWILKFSVHTLFLRWTIESIWLHIRTRPSFRVSRSFWLVPNLVKIQLL